MLIIVLACQNTPVPTATWVPPYLQVSVCSGTAHARWAGASDWTPLQNGDQFVVHNRGEIRVQGEARLCLGDGSVLELSPGTRIELQNPSAFPLLDILLQYGEIVLTAQKASYRIGTPLVSMTLLEVPIQARIRLTEGTTQVKVEEGAMNCTVGEEIITLIPCWEMRKPEGEALYIGQFCATHTPAPSPTPIRTTASPTQPPTASPTSLPPSPTPSPTRPRILRTPTPTLPPPQSPTPTPTPEAPPPPPPPPPTQPPPTQPPPPPTDTLPPPPTNTPERPTPTPDRGTPGP